MAVFLAMAVLVAMPAAALAAGPDPFTGSYRAIDTSFDNSNILWPSAADQPPPQYLDPGPEGIPSGGLASMIS